MLSRAGPLGGLGLLFTPSAMVLAQTLLALPIIAAPAHRAADGIWGAYDDDLRISGANRVQSILTVLAIGHAEAPFITVASTTSTEQSGLFGALLPAFTEATGIEVRVVAVGTGQALKLGERGDADVLLVHDRSAELRFITEGWGVARHDLMYKDFIVIGPKADPAGVAGSKDAVAAFRKIAGAKAPFVTRGDDSGTNAAELRFWRDAGIDPKAASDGKGQGAGWYKDIGGGMGAALNMAAAVGACTLSDRGTWLNFGSRQDLAAAVEADQRLFNQYGVMLVNPVRHPAVKAVLGQRFIDWLTAPEGQAAIAGYKINGEQLFLPDVDRPGL